MVTAYPVAGKKKSQEICLAFVRGCGGQIGTTLRDGPAVFYGVDASNEQIWREVRASGRDYYYIDNAFFDATRQEYFRVAKNRLQHPGTGRSDGARFRELGVEMKPWRAAGKHVVVCPQSDHFMRTVVGFTGNWCEQAVAALKLCTDREIRVRGWQRDKGALAATLGQDLEGAHALVAWSSAAAISAVLAGVPALVMSPDCAAGPMAGSKATEIERLPQRERENWAGVLADQQWNLDEFRNGTAWLNLQK